MALTNVTVECPKDGQQPLQAAMFITADNKCSTQKKKRKKKKKKNEDKGLVHPYIGIFLFFNWLFLL